MEFIIFKYAARHIGFLRSIANRKSLMVVGRWVHCYRTTCDTMIDNIVMDCNIIRDNNTIILSFNLYTYLCVTQMTQLANWAHSIQCCIKRRSLSNIGRLPVSAQWVLAALRCTHWDEREATHSYEHAIICVPYLRLIFHPKVIQRRDDFGEPRENFNRDWADYKNGFGDPAKEFWLGNENIYMLTNNEDYMLRVELEDFEGNKRYICKM